MWSLRRDFIESPWRGFAPVREGTETDRCDGWMNGVGVELAQGFFGLVDLLGGIGDVVCPDGFGSVLDEGLAGIESMSIAELPGDSGFALLGEFLLAVAPKGTKRSCPTIRVSLRSTPLVPSLLRGPAYKGHPWPFTPLAASMPLAPLRNDCTQPPERGDWRCCLVSAMSRSGAVSTGLWIPRSGAGGQTLAFQRHDWRRFSS